MTEKVTDLMAALEASLARAKARLAEKSISEAEQSVADYFVEHGTAGGDGRATEVTE